MVQGIIVPQMKTSRLLQMIVEQIESGKLSVGDRLPAERDLAKLYSCSRSTVRSSLEQLERMSYIRRQQGRGTFISGEYKQGAKGKQLKTIGIILVTGKDEVNNDPYVNQIMSALQNTSSQYTVNYNLLVLHYNERLENHLADKGLSISSFDGYVALAYEFSDDEIEFMRKYDIPVTSCASVRSSQKISSVQIDNSSGAYIAANHLFSLGRKHLMLLNDRADSEFAIAKREGFSKALREHGIAYKENMECGIIPYEDSLSYETVKKLLNKSESERPDALIVYGDWATYGAVKAIREAGLKVPDDIALVMYDDFPWVSKVLGLPITSVRQPLTEQVSHALSLVLEQIDNSKEKVNTIEILQPQLVVRRSCGSGMQDNYNF